MVPEKLLSVGALKGYGKNVCSSLINLNTIFNVNYESCKVVFSANTFMYSSRLSLFYFFILLERLYRDESKKLTALSNFFNISCPIL